VPYSRWLAQPMRFTTPKQPSRSWRTQFLPAESAWDRQLCSKVCWRSAYGVVSVLSNCYRWAPLLMFGHQRCPRRVFPPPIFLPTPRSPRSLECSRLPERLVRMSTSGLVVFRAHGLLANAKSLLRGALRVWVALTCIQSCLFALHLLHTPTN